MKKGGFSEFRLIKESFFEKHGILRKWGGRYVQCLELQRGQVVIINKK